VSELFFFHQKSVLTPILLTPILPVLTPILPILPRCSSSPAVMLAIFASTGGEKGSGGRKGVVSSRNRQLIGS